MRAGTPISADNRRDKARGPRIWKQLTAYKRAGELNRKATIF